MNKPQEGDTQSHKFFFPVQTYRKIGAYLCQRDKLSLHSCHPVVREITSNSAYWHTIEFIRSDNKYFAKQLDWMSKAMHNFQPQTLIISLYEKNPKLEESLLTLLTEATVDSITNLDIYCENQDVHLACSICFPNLEELTIRSRCATNELIQFMSQSLNKLHSLEVIKNDMQFTCEKLSKYMLNPMHKLVVKPYMVQFNEIAEIAIASQNTLNELEIDVEQCEEQQIIKIIQPLRNLSKLRLYHLQNLCTDNSLFKVLEKQSKFQELAITKVYNFQLTRILRAISSSHLLTLNLNDCKYVQDGDLVTVAQQCPNLRDLNVSWCNALTCKGLSAIIKNSINLETLNITGVKETRDVIFGEYVDLLSVFNESKFNSIKDVEKMKENPEIYDDDFFFNQPVKRERIKILKKLKLLDCQSCNFISDNILKIIYIINPRARVYNYFGNYMGLFPNDNESTFC